MDVSFSTSTLSVSFASATHVKSKHISTLQNNLSKVSNAANGKFTSVISQKIEELGKQAQEFKSSIESNKGTAREKEK